MTKTSYIIGTSVIPKLVNTVTIINNFTEQIRVMVNSSADNNLYTDQIIKYVNAGEDITVDPGAEGPAPPNYNIFSVSINKVAVNSLMEVSSGQIINTAQLSLPFVTNSVTYTVNENFQVSTKVSNSN